MGIRETSRLETINNAEEAKYPITTGLLLGITETKEELIQDIENLILFTRKNKILDNSNLVSSLSSQLIFKKNILNEKSNKLETLNTELLDVIKKQSLNLEINEALIENEIKYINEYLSEKEYSNKNNKSRFYSKIYFPWRISSE